MDESGGGRYPFREIEKKWQGRWADAKVHKATQDASKQKYYVLVMFPYPSGSGLHVGHCKNYVPGDVVARFKAMQGFNVLNPMGWDAFGQPAEQDAIKRGVNPRTVVPTLAEVYKKQLNILGVSYDWDREINSTDPSYYRWNQWMFLKLYEKGLAYRDAAPVNWCVNESTVLANEEVVDGKCWRCDGPVIKKPLPQWKLRITSYADRLLAGLDGIDWAEGLKTQQRDWIGRSEGAEVEFKLAPPSDGGGGGITVFTTRPDTLWGATFMVLSPEHPLVAEITTDAQKAAVEAYAAEAAKKSDEDRTAEGKEKTGVFTGAYATNPVNGQPIPIWIADYVLTGYGTGAIMAVPAHDQRDFEFAHKFDLPIVLVYAEADTPVESELTEAFASGGTFREALGSPFSGEAQDKSVIVPKVVAWIEEKGCGRGKIQYRLRDWLLSRQRYWGTPIPMVHCPSCGIVPVPENQLPVVLPDCENYKPGPDGRSPLSTIESFVKTTCPNCGQAAERETDTMAGSVDSSWYFLRFADPHNENAAWDKAIADYWMPIDMYIGGREHAVGHLLYCRFFTKFFQDLGLISVDEPAAALRNQGMLNAFTPVLSGTDKSIKPGEFVHYPRDEWIAQYNANKAPIPAERIIEVDGQQKIEPIEVEFSWLKMSKSKQTAVTPDEMADKYGADSLRTLILFEAPFEDTIQWSEERMNGPFRFLARVWDTVSGIVSAPPPPGASETLPSVLGGDLPDNWAPMPDADVKALRRKLHQTIAKVTDDIESFRFNTVVSALMILHDALRKFCNAGGVAHPAARETAEGLTLLLAPLAPHLADDLWEKLGGQELLFRGPWPVSDPSLAANEEVTVVVQINGKVREKLTLPAGLDNDALEAAALDTEKVRAELADKTIRKIIVVPGRLVNIVAN